MIQIEFFTHKYNTAFVLIDLYESMSSNFSNSPTSSPTSSTSSGYVSPVMSARHEATLARADYFTERLSAVYSEHGCISAEHVNTDMQVPIPHYLKHILAGAFEAGVRCALAHTDRTDIAGGVLREDTTDSAVCNHGAGPVDSYSELKSTISSLQAEIQLLDGKLSAANADIRSAVRICPELYTNILTTFYAGGHVLINKVIPECIHALKHIAMWRAPSAVVWDCMVRNGFTVEQMNPLIKQAFVALLVQAIARSSPEILYIVSPCSIDRGVCDIRLYVDLCAPMPVQDILMSDRSKVELTYVSADQMIPYTCSNGKTAMTMPQYRRAVDVVHWNLLKLIMIAEYDTAKAMTLFQQMLHVSGAYITGYQHVRRFITELKHLESMVYQCICNWMESLVVYKHNHIEYTNYITRKKAGGGGDYEVWRLFVDEMITVNA